MTTFSIAATGMAVQQNYIDTIANNLANVNTTAFQRSLLVSTDLHYENKSRMGVTSSDTTTIVPTGIQKGLGAKVAAVYRINEQGELKKTDNPLDIAIQGRGFFRVELPDGTFGYTRAGHFQLSPDGEIVTTKGFTVTPGLVIPANATDTSINANGVVEVSIPGQSDPQNIGQLDLVSFMNPAGLEATGDNILLETTASGTPVVGLPNDDGLGTTLQGFIETANTDPIEGITDLITAQRAYELGSKVIQTQDEIESTNVNLKR